MVPTNSDRQSIQLYIENSIGCTNPRQINDLKSSFKSFKILNSTIVKIGELLDKDAIALYEKACQTFIQGVDDLSRGLESWAVVKLYYSTFYFLRCQLAMNEIALIRCGAEIYTLKISVGSSPVHWNNRLKRTDHKATIGIFEREFGKSDILLSQKIDDQPTYDWLAMMREWANYKSRSFPENFNISYFYSTSIYDIGEQLDLFLRDEVPIYCFDSDYACLALPLKRAQISSQIFQKSHLKLSANFIKTMKSRIDHNPILQRLNFLIL